MRPKLSAHRRLRRRCRTSQLLAATAAALLLAGCAQPQSALQRIRARGELRVVTLNDATSYYLGAQGPQGFEYRLASAFARQLQVRLVMQPLPDAAAMRAALAGGRADLAAAQISPDAQWLHIGLATDTYDQIAQLVVQGRGKSHAHDLSALRQSKVVVREGSPQLDRLRSLRRNDMPDLSWVALRADQPDPLQMVSRRRCRLCHRRCERIRFRAPSVSGRQRRVRATGAAAAEVGGARRRTGPGTGSECIFCQRQGFWRASRASRAMQVSRRTVSIMRMRIRFQADISTRLPQLQAMFEEAAQSTGLDWRLLAAVGYQESKWQTQATLGRWRAGHHDADQRYRQRRRRQGSLRSVAEHPWRRQVSGTGHRHHPQAASASPIVPGWRSPPTTSATGTWRMRACWHRCAARTRTRGTTYARSFRCWRRNNGIRALKRGYARGWEPARFVDQVQQYLAVLEWSGTGTVARAVHAPAITAGGDGTIAIGSAPLQISPALLEEIPQQRTALLGQHATEHIDA